MFPASQSFGSEGEYGWDGWLGSYVAMDPKRKPCNNICHTRNAAAMVTEIYKLYEILCIPHFNHFPLELGKFKRKTIDSLFDNIIKFKPKLNRENMQYK